jgi:hypothetical protein
MTFFTQPSPLWSLIIILKLFQIWFQYRRYIKNIRFQICSRIRIQIWNHFGPWIRRPKGIVWRKNRVAENLSQRDSVTKIIVAPIATKKIIVLRIATVKSLIWERIAKGLFLLWQTAAHLRAVCLLVILVVVNRGIGAHLPEKSVIYLQVILHPQSPVSVAVSFYVRLYTCKTYTRRIV